MASKGVARTPEKQLIQQRAYQARNREKMRAQSRAWGARNRDRRKIQTLWDHHGLRPHDWAVLWDAQGGRCYLCGEPLDAEKATVEHDHSCCGDGRSCSVCRRGLAHPSCNNAIGAARDDPDRLRLLADALERAQRGVAERMARCHPEQLTLLDMPPVVTLADVVDRAAVDAVPAP